MSDHEHLKQITIVNEKEYNRRWKRVKLFVQIARDAVDGMMRAGEITAADASTLSLADDTAAWVCGRVQYADFVTMRVHCSNKNFTGSTALSSFRFFDQLLEQLTLDPTTLKYFIYYCCDIIPAIKLIVCKTEKMLEFSNPCLQLSYLINVKDNKCVKTRDCNCRRVPDPRHGFVEIQFDESYTADPTDYHGRFLRHQEELIENPVDVKIVRIDCEQ
jgi:hypothetical protein